MCMAHIRMALSHVLAAQGEMYYFGVFLWCCFFLIFFFFLPLMICRIFEHSVDLWEVESRFPFLVLLNVLCDDSKMLSLPPVCLC